MPRYSETWDVSKVLAHLESQDLDKVLSLKLLTLRTVMLLALTRPSRSADLSKLNLAGYRSTPEGGGIPTDSFSKTIKAKQRTQGVLLSKICSKCEAVSGTLSGIIPGKN